MSSPLPPRYLRHLPWVGPWVRRLWKLDAENRALREERAAAHHHHRFVPLGHFYSPYPSLDDIEKALQVPQRETMPGIEIDDARQQRWLQRLVERSAEAPFPAQPSPGFRYHFENPSF